MQKIGSFFILFIFYSCTENPFGGDKKIADKTISGYVKLEPVSYTHLTLPTILLV